MRDKSELTIDINRARLAQDFINNPMFIEGVAVLKASTLDRFESLQPDQTNEMVDCNRMLKVIDEFENTYHRIINIGNSALEALDTIKSHEKDLSNER